MSFLSRVASLAAFSLCMLGAGSVATASQAAELTTASVPATLATPALPSAPAVSAPTATSLGQTVAGETPATRFASLEDAVAAQTEGLGETAADVACLAGAIYFEAKGEPLSGQLAVANVILNRARSGRFPPDVCGVVTQRGQFSFVRAGRMPLIAAAARGYHTALALARVAMAAAWENPTPTALFFHARRVGMGRGTQVAAIGNHIFYR